MAKTKYQKYNGFDVKNRLFWTEGWGSMALAILAALTIRWLFLEAYVIPSGSMFPSLLKNDHIFVNKLVYGIRFPFSENWMVKFREPERGGPAGCSRELPGASAHASFPLRRPGLSHSWHNLQG